MDRGLEKKMKEIVCSFMGRKNTHIEIHGTYSEGVAKDDIVKEFGAGDYHRFVFFDAGTFIYYKYEYADEIIE